MNDGTYLNIDGTFVLAQPKTGYWANTASTTLSDTLDGQYVGVWTNPISGQVYYDRSVWVKDLDTAIEIGKTHSQLAIWDIENETEVWLTDLKPEDD
jgi:hypothetical protein